MINKKSQIGSTLTWLVAFFIIFFIIIIFLSFTALISAKKIISSGSDVGIEKYDSSVLKAQRHFLNFLNSPAKVNGKKKKMSELIISSLDVYFDTKSEYPAQGSFVDSFGIYGLVDMLRSEARDRGFRIEDMQAIDEKKSEIASLISKKLKEDCSEFYILIPQALINEQGLSASPKVMGKDVFIDNYDNLLKFTPTISFKFYYKDKKIEIKYRELKEC